jgi:hypothetical protein
VASFFNPTGSDRMVAKGIEHSRAYSWKNTLEGHLSCYKELLDKKCWISYSENLIYDDEYYKSHQY